ncbi:MAG: PQQ-binding-like beta-propeller repeat protein [Verrucomicrobia bacterium]|nr:PQQ-binding-like beta-propeller repeat protein [Verrucomicrobiota bacterium]
MRIAARFACLAVLLAGPGHDQALAASGWLNWRGPNQNGVSPAKDKLPDTLELGGPNYRWSYKVRGAGAPVIADGRVYAFGFYGETTDVEETLLCLDARTGAKIWEHRFRDYLSDTTYNRYAIGAPVVDAETGNIYLESTFGHVFAWNRDGKLLWQHSMMEEFGRLTFPNGRTGGLVVEGNLVITDGITANWGADGPARNRFYAFDKRTGEICWFSTPGIEPIDSTFATPVYGNIGNQRAFYQGTGCGHVVSINARTGEPIWRFRLSGAGVNADVVLVGPDKMIAVHGKENMDATHHGRMVLLKIPTEYPAGPKPVVLGKEAELWRNDDIVAFSSSPIVVGQRVYSTVATGSLVCVDLETGKTVWSEKLGPDQLHASPAYADGKLYVPLHPGTVTVLKDAGDKAQILSVNQMGAPCLGAPSFYGDSVFIFTKEGLHCFGVKSTPPAIPPAATVAAEALSTAPITQLQVVPAEFALAPGESQTFTVWGLDATGRRVKNVAAEAKFEKFIPPTALVKSEVDCTIEGNVLKTTSAAKLSAGAFKITWNNLATTACRGRVVASYGFKEDFEKLPLGQKNEFKEDVGFPPLPWLGARVKWHALDKDGSRVLANRLDTILFQRTMNFIGKAGMKNYTIEADVMTDGNRRIMSTVGLVNQRYLIAMTGNSRILEITSNHERLKESVPFDVQANTWYHLKTRVDADKSGPGGFVRAKLWIKGQPEPNKWTIELRQEKLHQEGAPAVFAFSPQSQKRVFIDNLSISANE